MVGSDVSILYIQPIFDLRSFNSNLDIAIWAAYSSSTDVLPYPELIH